MRKQYKIVDKSYGEYIEFKKIQPNIEECERLAKDYNLTDYIILEREVTEWTKVY